MKAALITTTRYTSASKVRYALALKTVEKAAKSHIPIYIVDTSESDHYAKSFSSLGATVKRLDNLKAELATQRSTVMRMAINEGKDCLVFTEPEKVNIIDYFDQIVEPINKKESKLVIPYRTSKSWGSYPPQMSRTEAFGQEMIKEFCKDSYDLMFGPWAADQSVFNHFLTCNDLSYSWSYTARLEIIKRSPELVGQVGVDFIYPSEQMEQEEAAGLQEYGRRMMQLPSLFFSLNKVYLEN